MPAQGAHCISITITLCTTEVNSSDSTMIPNTTRVEIRDTTIPTLHTRTVYIPTSRCCLNYHHHSRPFRVTPLRTETMITQLLFVDSHYTAPSLKLLDMVSLHFSQSFSTTTSHWWPPPELHVKPQKHERGKKRLALNSQRESQALKKIGWEYHPEGETLPDSIRVYWVKLVSAAGVPLNKSMDLLYQLQVTSGKYCHLSFMKRSAIWRNH